MATEYLNNKTFESIIEKFQVAKKQKARNALIIDELRETILRKKKRKAKHDAEDKALAEAIQIHRVASEIYIEYQNKLAIAFSTLAENIVRYAKFHLIDPDDATQECVMICFEKIDRFDPKKGKAFNYMTTCSLNHLRQLYRTSRNYNELKRKFSEFMELKLNIVVKNNRQIIGPDNYSL